MYVYVFVCVHFYIFNMCTFYHVKHSIQLYIFQQITFWGITCLGHKPKKEMERREERRGRRNRNERNEISIYNTI